MATTVTIETDKIPPPKGSLRRNRLEVDVQSAVSAGLNDQSVRVEVKKKGR